MHPSSHSRPKAFKVGCHALPSCMRLVACLVASCVRVLSRLAFCCAPVSKKKVFAGLAQQGPRKPIPKVPGKPSKAAAKSSKPAAPKAATALGKRPPGDKPASSAKRPAQTPAATPAADGPAPAPGGDQGKPARQRKKASDVSAEDAVAAVRAAHAQGTLAKLGLLELKAFLKANGKPVGGKKAEVLERAQAVLAA